MLEHSDKKVVAQPHRLVRLGLLLPVNVCIRLLYVPDKVGKQRHLHFWLYIFCQPGAVPFSTWYWPASHSWVPKTHPLHGAKNFSVWLSPKIISTWHDYTPPVAREAATKITAKKSRTLRTGSVLEKAWDEVISGLKEDIGRKDVALDSMLYSKEQYQSS